jgi:glucose-1-phosphate thymidylyltransferase
VKLLISLLPLETLYQPDRWPRPVGLWQLAGEPIIGHVLAHLRELWDAPSAELCFVVGQKDGPLATWVHERFAGRPAHLLALPANLTITQVAWQTREWWRRDEPVWLLEGNTILEADFYADTSDLRMLVPVGERTATPVGIYSRIGTELWSSFSGYPPTLNLNGLWERLLEDQANVGVTDTYTFLPIVERAGDHWQSREELLLHANARLLGLGSGSQDAIERSYVEDFTVLPPVYLHESAVIYGAVIGPYASIEAGATVRHSVVSNSIVGAGVQISNIILDGAIVGEGARINGRQEALLVGDSQEYSRQ